MSHEILVRARGVRKKFCRSLKKSLWYGMKDIAAELNPFKGKAGDGAIPKLRDGEFWAVNDVSFELRRGECLGLLGRNGAGKTTLLKMLNGLIKPDAGEIEMHGAVGAMISLGAGFNPILSGRENIYISGSILGLSTREINAKVDGIIDFAEIRDFIDAPVQTYSSGMQVRLGFAVASSLNPDVLILDEVLAVGDFAFRMKCFERITSLKRNCAVIFVSHHMHQVSRLCNRGLCLHKGRTLFFGDLAEAIDTYETGVEDAGGGTMFKHATFDHADFSLASEKVGFGDPLPLQVNARSLEERSGLLLRVSFISSAGEFVAEWMSSNHGQFFDLPANRSVPFQIQIPRILLRPGVYTLECSLATGDNMISLIRLRGKTRLTVQGATNMILTNQL